MPTALKGYEPVSEAQDQFWTNLGIPSDGLALHAAVHEGFPYAVYASLAALLGLDRKDLAKYAAIPQTTLQRRYKAGRFNAEESDRLFRIAEVTKAAIGLCGNVELAQHWLSNPARGLGYRRPLDMLATSVETRAVMTVIGQIEYGVYI